jgi:carbonic anhydrase/acetyltransferase-like protein (isoleucine patch superfamily)
VLRDRTLRDRARDVTSAVLGWLWWSAVEGGKVRSGSVRAARFGAFGEGTTIGFPPSDLIGPEAIHIGRGCAIGAEVALAAGYPTQQFAPGCPPVIEIGDHCSIGRGSFLVAIGSIVIEDDVTIAPNVYITDHNHTYAELDEPIGRQWPEQADTRIGAGSWLGTNVVVLAGAQLGRHVTVAAGSVVRGVVPDHAVVAGVPARVVRRWSDDEGWVPPLRDATTPDEGRTHIAARPDPRPHRSRASGLARSSRPPRRSPRRGTTAERRRLEDEAGPTDP